MITHPVAAPQRRLPAAGCPGTGCVPRPLRRWEQLRKLLNVEGCPMLSPDQSQTVIMTSTCSPSGSRSRRDAPSPGSGRSTGPTAERPTAAELARAQRCGKTAVPNLRLIRSRHPTSLRYPYGGGRRQVAALLADLTADCITLVREPPAAGGLRPHGRTTQGLT